MRACVTIHVVIGWFGTFLFQIATIRNFAGHKMATTKMFCAINAVLRAEIADWSNFCAHHSTARLNSARAVHSTRVTCASSEI